MASYLWRKYADYLYTKWERTILWDMVEPYRRPKSFTPLVTIYIAAFYTGVVGAAITEQLYKCHRIVWRMMTHRESSAPLLLIAEARIRNSIVFVCLIKNSLAVLMQIEKYWEDHPGEAVPLMKPKFYYGPWRIMRGEVPPTG